MSSTEKPEPGIDLPGVGALKDSLRSLHTPPDLTDKAILRYRELWTGAQLVRGEKLPEETEQAVRRIFARNTVESNAVSIPGMGEPWYPRMAERARAYLAAGRSTRKPRRSPTANRPAPPAAATAPSADEPVHPGTAFLQQMSGRQPAAV